MQVEFNACHIYFCEYVGEFYAIFAFRFSFWALLDTQLTNLFESMVFLIIQDLRSKFTTHGSILLLL